jgi:hypothetical protein
MNSKIPEINATVRNLNKINVSIRNDFKLDSLFELDGESPVFISKIYQGNLRILHKQQNQKSNTFLT